MVEVLLGLIAGILGVICILATEYSSTYPKSRPEFRHSLRPW